MDKKLHNEDAHVVDMLLDRGNSEGLHGAQIFTRSPEMFHQHLQSVERLLKLLDKMPTSEPPANIVARTLDYIDHAIAAQPHAAPVASTNTAHRPSA